MPSTCREPRPSAPGSYLDFAERGGEALRAEVTQDGDRDFDSPFEREVARALE